MGCSAVWWWQPIQLAKRRARLALRVLASSMNSSLPVSRSRGSPPLMCALLYLHRGASASALADEDQEQDPDRWVSHAATGQEVWQLISQWVWNLRLELGHQLHPDPVRTTEFASALPSTRPQEQEAHP